MFTKIALAVAGIGFFFSLGAGALIAFNLWAGVESTSVPITGRLIDHTAFMFIGSVILGMLAEISQKLDRKEPTASKFDLEEHRA